jgi:Kef-type K+ transport system membrane component KefB
VSEITGILFDLFLVFLAAKVAAELFERLHQPPVIGELVAGAIIGPYALGWIGVPDQVLIDAFHGDAATAAEAMALVSHVIGELSVVVLLFFVGLETRLSDILSVGGRASSVAVAGVILPFVLGYGLFAFVLGQSQVESVFVGAAMVATSVGITARVLRDLGVIASRASRIILGAAVIDDILGMVILAVVVGLAATGTVSFLSLATITGQAVVFTVGLVVGGSWVVRRYGLGLARLKMDNAPFAVALLAMLGLATLSAAIGLAAIIGAFLAGMVFAEAREHFELQRQALPIYQFLVPFFFVFTGAQVDLRLFLDGGVMGIALAVTVLAIVGKLLGCGLAMLGNNTRQMMIVGVGMAPRGEVGLIVANLGLALGAVSGQVFNVVVVMSILTTIVAPPVLRLLYVGDPETEISPEDVASPAGQLPEL